MSLRAGQRLTARLASRELRIDQAAPAAPSAQASPSGQTGTAAEALAPAPIPALAPEPVPALEPAPVVAVKPETRAPSSRGPLVRRAPAPVVGPRWHPAAWPTRVAGGESDAIVAEVDLHGVERTLAEVDGAALAALADAARYARRNELAVRTLMEQRQRFPISLAARTAAFQLGRLADDGGAAQTALGWYRRYLTEAPTGPYAAEALGREMLTVERLSSRDAARAVRARVPAAVPRWDLPPAGPLDPGQSVNGRTRRRRWRCWSPRCSSGRRGCGAEPASVSGGRDRAAPPADDRVLRETSWRVRSELDVAGMSSRMIDCPARPARPADAGSTTRRWRAICALARRGDRAITVAATLPDGLELRRRVRVDPAQGGDEPSVIAVRAVELLRDIYLDIPRAIRPAGAPARRRPAAPVAPAPPPPDPARVRCSPGSAC